MERKNFIIMYLEDGEEKTVETKETIETLKKRLNCYKSYGIKILNVEEKVVVTKLINMQEQLKKWGY